MMFSQLSTSAPSVCRLCIIFHPTSSLITAHHPPPVRCTLNDRYNSLLFEHGVVSQAVAVAGPQGTTSALRSFICKLTYTFTAVAPPWFQQLYNDLRNDMRDMRVEILQDLKRVLPSFPLFLDIADF